MQRHIDRGNLNLVLFDYLINNSNNGEFTLGTVMEDFNTLGLKAELNEIETVIKKYIKDGFVETDEGLKYRVLL